MHNFSPELFYENRYKQEYAALDNNPSIDMADNQETLALLKSCAGRLGVMMVEASVCVQPRPTAAAARAFADALMLLRDDAAALSLMRQDPVGAAAFVQFLSAALKHAPTTELLGSIGTPLPGLPFYSAAAVVVEVTNTWSRERT